MILKKIKPLFTSILTTMNKYNKDVKVNGLIVETAGTMRPYQKVIAVGSAVREIKPGDLVSVNPERYAVKKYEDGSMHDGIIDQNKVISYNLPIVIIDGKECLLLQDRDVDFVIEEYDDKPDKETASTSIITDIKPPILS